MSTVVVVVTESLLYSVHATNGTLQYCVPVYSTGQYCIQYSTNSTVHTCLSFLYLIMIDVVVVVVVFTLKTERKLSPPPPYEAGECSSSGSRRPGHPHSTPWSCERAKTKLTTHVMQDKTLCPRQYLHAPLLSTMPGSSLSGFSPTMSRESLVGCCQVRSTYV